MRADILEALIEAVALLKERLDALQIPAAKISDTQLKKIAQQWLQDHADEFKGADGTSVTPEEIAAAAATWLEANKASLQGQDAAAVTPEQIQAAVVAWMQVNKNQLRGPPGIAVARNGKDATDEQVAAAVQNFMQRNPIPIPADGKNATDEQVAEAVVAWMRQHPITIPKAEPGKAGKDGAGIDTIEETTTGFTIRLTDGREFKFKFNKSGTNTVLVAGSAGSRGGGSGSDKQQVFIDVQPDIDYPAISFSQVAGYPGLSTMSVNE